MKPILCCVSLCLVACALGCRSDRDHDDYDSTDRGSYSSASSASKPAKSTPPSTVPSKASDKQTENASASVSNAGVTASDRQFVEQAAQGGMFEVESSRIAETKAVSNDVRDFANMMVDDHGKANSELQSLAKAKGMTVPATLASEHQRKLDELRDLTGAPFDSKYHSMQVAAHDDAIELFEKASRDLTDPELRAFVTKTLPTLRKHRVALDSIQVPR